MNDLAPSSLIGVLLLTAPEIARAHAAFAGAEGFYGGLLHPLVVPQHALTTVAVGLLIEQQTRGRIAVLAFAVGLAIGFVAIATAYTPSYPGEMVLVIAVVAGAMVAFKRPLPRIFVGLLVAAAGVAIALDSPPEVISVRDAIVIQLGTFCGAILLILAVVELASRLDRDWQRIGARILGSWTAASAILVLALRLAK